MECKTFRAYGHGDHDDDRANKYRSPEEIEHGRARDPIAVCRRKLIELGDLTGDAATAYQAEGKASSQASIDDFPPEVVEYMDEGIRYALASAVPSAEEGGRWVFNASDGSR